MRSSLDACRARANHQWHNFCYIDVRNVFAREGNTTFPGCIPRLVGGERERTPPGTIYSKSMPAAVLRRHPVWHILRRSIAPALLDYARRCLAIVATKISTGVECERIDPMGFCKNMRVAHFYVCQTGCQAAPASNGAFFHVTKDAKRAPHATNVCWLCVSLGQVSTTGLCQTGVFEHL